jgi:hypothetical protein
MLDMPRGSLWVIIAMLIVKILGLVPLVGRAGPLQIEQVIRGALQAEPASFLPSIHLTEEAGRSTAAANVLMA